MDLDVEYSVQPDALLEFFFWDRDGQIALKRTFLQSQINVVLHKQTLILMLSFPLKIAMDKDVKLTL